MSSLQPDECAVVVELRRLPLGLLIKLRYVHQNLSVRGQLDVCTIHRPRRWSFEVHTFVVITAAVTWALEFVFRRLPIGSASQMRTPRVDHEQAIRATVHPDAIFLLPLRINTKSVILRIANFERSRGLKQSAWQEKSEECQEPRGEKCRNHRPCEAPPLLIDFIVFRTNCGHAARFSSFRRADRRSSNVANGVASTRDRGSSVDRNSLGRRCSGPRNRSGSSSRRRCSRRRRGRFTEQRSNLSIIQRSNAVAFALSIFRGNRRLAPLLAGRNLFCDFGTDVARDSDGGGRSRGGSGWGGGNRCGWGFGGRGGGR